MLKKIQTCQRNFKYVSKNLIMSVLQVKTPPGLHYIYVINVAICGFILKSAEIALTALITF